MDSKTLKKFLFDVEMGRDMLYQYIYGLYAFCGINGHNILPLSAKSQICVCIIFLICHSMDFGRFHTKFKIIIALFECWT